MLAAIILEVMEKAESDALKVMIFMIEGTLPENYFSSNLKGTFYKLFFKKNKNKMALLILIITRFISGYGRFPRFDETSPTTFIKAFGRSPK